MKIEITKVTNGYIVEVSHSNVLPTLHKIGYVFENLNDMVNYVKKVFKGGEEK